MNSYVDGLIERVRQVAGEAGDSELRVMRQLKHRLHVSRDTNRQFDENLTFGQRLADQIAAFVGSWAFIMIFVGLLSTWVVLNAVLLMRIDRAFDPYPFILLNLVLSMVAALQAPLIMMSQNRQAAKDRLQAEHDYEVNLKAEMEVLALHEKLDALRDSQWSELVRMQQEQLALLGRLLEERNR